MNSPGQERVSGYRMRIDLGTPRGGSVAWPPGIAVRRYLPSDARPLHDLLVRGYRGGGGSVSTFEEWLPQTTGDPQWDPALCFLAQSGGLLAGVALCWTSAFVKDLVVDEQWRRRGVGEALLRQALETFAHRGAPAVELKVHATNAAAIRLYERIGFQVVEQLSDV